MARKTKEDARETRWKILLAALDLFSEQGYTRTTFVDIARRIGMTKGAVYWHFEDKPRLLAAIIVEMHARERALVADLVPAVYSLDDVKAYFVAQTRVVTEDERCRKFAFFMTLQMEWSVELISIVHDLLMEVRGRPFQNVEEFLRLAKARGELRPEVDIVVAKDILVGLWRGLLSNHFSGLSSCDLAETVNTAVGIYLESIRVNKELSVE